MLLLYWMLTDRVHLGFRQLLYCTQVALKSQNPFLLQVVPGTIRIKYAETGIFWNSTGVGVRQKQEVFNKFSTNSLHTNEQFVLENVLSILFYY